MLSTRLTPRTSPPTRDASPPMRAGLTGRLAAFGIALAALLGAGASPALAHDQLVDTKLTTDARGVRLVELTFSNSIIDVGTEITVVDANGAELAAGPPSASGPVVQQPLTDPLPEGTATAAWRVVSSDGHPIEGVFGIEVDDSGAATIVTAPQPETAAAAAASSASTDGSAAADSSATAGVGVSPLAIGIAAGAGVLVLGAVAAAVFVRSRRGSRPQDTEIGQ